MQIDDMPMNLNYFLNIPGMTQEVKVWAQMFFDDGSVTQGIRIPAEWLDEGCEFKINEVADLLMKSAMRDEGWLLIWGAGNMVFNHYPTSFFSKAPELDSSV